MQRRPKPAVLFIGYLLPSADPLIINLIKKSMGDSKKYFLMERSEVVVKRYTENWENQLIFLLPGIPDPMFYKSSAE
jgi:hypothetical protein